MDNIDHFVNSGDEAVQVNIPVWAGATDLIALARSDDDNRNAHVILASLFEGLARAIAATLNQPTTSQLLSAIHREAQMTYRVHQGVRNEKSVESFDILTEMVEEIRERAIWHASKS